MNFEQCINYDKLQEEIESDEIYYHGELHITNVSDLLGFLERTELTLSKVRSKTYTKEQFDEVTYAMGYAHYFEHDKTVRLDGEFTYEALQIIDYAVNNHPEWFKLDDHS